MVPDLQEIGPVFSNFVDTDLYCEYGPTQVKNRIFEREKDSGVRLKTKTHLTHSPDRKKCLPVKLISLIFLEDIIFSSLFFLIDKKKPRIPI